MAQAPPERGPLRLPPKLRKKSSKPIPGNNEIIHDRAFLSSCAHLCIDHFSCQCLKLTTSWTPNIPQLHDLVCAICKHMIISIEYKNLDIVVTTQISDVVAWVVVGNLKPKASR